jgi:hypothetical protein
MTYKISTKKKWIKTDAWRGYEQPAYAVLGSSDTGTWEDSPCPSYEVDKELKDFQKFLQEKGIKSKIINAKSSNVFMIKRWIVPEQNKYIEVKKLAEQYLKEKKEEIKYIHEAD